MNAILGVGICVLVVWCVRRIVHPEKLKLADAPGRANSVNPVHIAALLILVAAALLLSAQVLLFWVPKDSNKFRVLSGLIEQVLTLAGVLIVAKITFRLGLARGFGLSLRRWMADGARGVIGYLAVIPVCTGVFLLTILVISPKKHDLLVAVRDMETGWRILAIISAVVLAPLAEETLFRGLLQSMLRKYIGHPWPAILIASVFFAFAHHQYPDAMPTLFVLSIVLGYNYERCGRLVPSILIHMLFNAVNVAECLWWTEGQ